jgi:hypothetical protein
MVFAMVIFGVGPSTLPAQVLRSGLISEVSSLDAAVTASELVEDPQEVPKGPVSTNDAGPEGVVPAQKGFNASLNTTSQHDGAAGWQSILTPNVAYRMNRFLSVNLGLPVYTYQVVSRQTGTTKTKPSTPIFSDVAEHSLLGDTSLTGEFSLNGRWLDYSLTGTLGMPTGDDADGLGAGQFTYTFTNHLEHAVNDWLTPDIELGIGDSPNLDDARLRKSYTTVGTGAHFQAGVNVSMWRGISFDSEAYEDLPLGTQTVTSVTSNGKKGKKAATITTTSQKSVGEDNGFLNTLDVPLGHVVLTAVYNHSLRNDDNTAGFGITFLLRAPKRSAPDPK